MRNACFGSSKPFILTSKINPKNKFFQNAFLDTIAYDFIQILYKNGRFGVPCKIQLATKWHPNRPSCIKNLHLTSSPAYLFSLLILECILTAIWFTLGVFLIKNGRFGEPFKIHLATKWHPKQPSCVKTFI